MIQFVWNIPRQVAGPADCNENAASQDIESRTASPSEKGDAATRTEWEHQQSAADPPVISEPTHSQIGTWL